jgi:hypothetical protein
MVPAGWEEAYYTLPSRKFLYDVTNPVAGVSLPENTKYYQTLTTISGTASDPAPTDGLSSDVSEVKVAIRKQEGVDYYYWSVLESSWVLGGITPAEVNFNTTTFSAGIWWINISSPIWQDGKQYRIYARAKDNTNTGNLSNVVYNDFIFDVSSPTAKITTLVNNGIYSSLTQITGTAFDPVGVGGNAGLLDKVQVHIERPAQGGYPLRYWDAANHTWDASQPKEAEIYWGTATIHMSNVSASSWTFTNLPSASDWTHNFVYIIRCRAKDQALPSGNTQQIFVVSESSFTIIWDNQPPTVSITSYEDPDGNGRVNPGVDGWLIQGQAVDTPAGIPNVANIRLRITRLEGNTTYYWTGTAWSTTESEFIPDSYISPNWDYTFTDVNQLISDQVYKIYVRAIDNAIPPNVGSFGAPVEVIIDTTPPVSKPTYPKDGGFYRSVSLTTISGTANGDLAGIDYVQIKIDKWNPSLGQWETAVDWHNAQYIAPNIYFSTRQPVGGWQDNTKYAFWLRAYDRAGNAEPLSSISSNTFVVDNTLPSISVTIPAELSNWNTLHITSGTVSDSGSYGQYVTTVTVAIVKSPGTAEEAWWNGSDGFTSVSPVYSTATLVTGGGWQYTGFGPYLEDNKKYRFYIRVYDAAGNNNEGSEIIRNVTIDKTAPSCFISYPQEGKFYPTVSVISGTATDPNTNASRVNRIRYSIKDVTANKWWDFYATPPTWGPAGGAEVTLDVLYPAAEPLSYSTSTANVDWIDGHQYIIYTQAFDQAKRSDDPSYLGNYNVQKATVGFIIDKTTPTAAITLPDPTIPDYYRNYNYLPTISGTANDATAGISKVWIVLKDKTLGYYWNGSYTGTGADWVDNIQRILVYNNPIPSPGTIIWISSITTLTTNRDYHLWVEVEDAAGNKLAVSDTDIGSNVGGVHFKFDNRAPVSYLSLPQPDSYFNTSLTLISGTVIDDNISAGSGVSQLRLKITRVDSNGTTWYFTAPGWSNVGPAAEIIISPTLINESQKLYQWEYGFTDWVDNYKYVFYVKSRDNTHLTTPDPNWETEKVFVAYFDTTRPTSKVTRPPLSSAGYDQAIPTISGTAQDVNVYASKVGKVEVAIKRLSDGLWWGGWNNPQWVSSTEHIWSTATITDVWVSSVNWIYNIGSTAWTDTTSYWIISRAQDRAGNYETNWSTTQWTCDTTPPTSRVRLPADGSEVDSLPLISGTCEDPYPGQVDRVGIIIYCTEGQTGEPPPPAGKYWSPTNNQWQTTPEIIYVYTSGPVWSWDASGVQWVARESPGYQYKISVRAWDKAGNKEIEVAASTITFNYSAPLPQTVITYPAAEGYYRITSDLNVTGSANAYTNEVWVQLSSGPGFTTYWSHYQNTWVEFSTWCPASGVNPWGYVFSQSIFENGVRYLVRSRGRGPAGWELDSNIENVYFNVDRTVPSGGITNIVNLEHYTGYGGAKNIDSIKGTAVDPDSTQFLGKVSSVKVQIKKKGTTLTYNDVIEDYESADNWLNAVADDGNFNSNNEPWTYTIVRPTATWKDEGEYEIYARVIDASLPGGNVYTSPAVNIVIDRTKPSSAVIFPNKDKHNFIPLISGTASDTPPGRWDDIYLCIKNLDTTYYWYGSYWDYSLSDVWISSSSLSGSGFTFWVSSWQYTGITDANWTSGFRYQVKCYAKDRAGNTEVPTEGISFIYDNTPPKSAVTVPSSGDKLNSLEYIQGTADDYPPQDEISGNNWVTGVSTTSLAIPPYDGVTIAIKGDTTGYWNGADWSSEEPFWWTVQYDSTTKVWIKTKVSLGTFLGRNNPPDGVYHIIPRAIDNARNFEVVFNTRTFIWDTTPPTSLTKYPSNGSYIATLTQITGTVYENVAGIAEVKVRLSSPTVDGPYFWTGSSWTTTPGDYLTATIVGGTGQVGISTWTITTGLPTLLDGVTYYIIAKSKDLAGNYETLYTTISFVCDKLGPQVQIVEPYDATPQDYSSPRLSVLTTISGTAEDPGIGTIQRVEYRISRVGLYYWDGEGYSAADYNLTDGELAWFVVQTTVTPQYSIWFVTHTFLSDARYMVEVRGVDVLGNYSVLYSTITFTFDQDVPQSFVNYPANGSTVRTVGQIRGTAYDTGINYPGSVTQVRVAIRRLSDGKWYDPSAAGGSGDFAQDSFFPIIANLVGNDWWYDISDSKFTSGTSYYVTVEARDNAYPPNIEQWFHIRSSTFTFDNTPPNVVIQRPPTTLQYYNQTNLTVISGTAVDATSQVQTVQIRIQRSSDNKWWIDPDGDGIGSWAVSGTTEIPCNIASLPTWSYSLANFLAEHGVRYDIWARAWDVPGTTSSWVGPQSFVYDIGVPSAAVVSPANESFVNTQIATISGTALDEPAGISSVEIAIASNSVSPAGSWWDPLTQSWTAQNEVWFSTNVSYNYIPTPNVWVSTTPPLENGKKYFVRLRITDRAGNVRILDSIKFTCDLTPPTIVLQEPQGHGPGNYYEGPNTLPIISGTAQDTSPGSVSSVRVWITTNPASPWYWNGASWQQEEYYFTADISGLPNWKLEPSVYGNPWVHNVLFRVVAQAYDSASNPSGSASKDFVYDAALPVSSITYPTSNINVRSLTVISGTMFDAQSGVAKVKCAIRHPSGTFWNGTGWVSYDADTCWLDAVVYQSSYVFTNLPTIWDDRTVYRCYVKAEDNVNNKEPDPTDWLLSGVPFRIDYSSPTSLISDGTLQSGTTRYLQGYITSVAGTASDLTGGSGVSEVRIRVKRADGLYMNAAENDWTTDLSFNLLASGAESWNKVFNSPQMFEDGYWYEIESQARDKVVPQPNVQQVYFPARFYVDKSSPVVSVQYPGSSVPNELHYNWSTNFTVYGTATDVEPFAGAWVSGVKEIAVAFMRLSDNKYLTSTGFDSDVSSFHICNIWPSSWTFNFNYAYLTDNTSYTVVSRVYDRANNYQLSTINYFVYDTSAPVSYVSLPQEGVLYDNNTLTTISGTAVDLVFGGLGKVAKVEFTLQRSPYGANDYWTGSAWGGETWLLANGVYDGNTYYWTYDVRNVLWNIDETEYKITSKATDKAGNVEISLPVRTFRFRPLLPNSAITLPQNNRYYSTLTQIAGTTENAEAIRVAIKRNSDGYYYTGSTEPANYWSATEVWLVPSGTQTWTYTLPSEVGDNLWVYGSSYTIRSKAKSLYGDRWQGDSGQLPITESIFWFDNVAPVSVVNLPPAGMPHYNVATLPVLSGTAYDEVSGISKVEYQLRDLTYPNTYWNAATQSWVSATELWNVANWNPPVWSTYVAVSAFTDGHRYRIQSKAYDNTLPLPGRIEVPSAGNEFIFDISIPTATVTRPPANGVQSVFVVEGQNVPAYKSSFVITGDMLDKSPGVVERVEVYIYDFVANQYYREPGWGDLLWISTETTSKFKVWTSSWTYDVGPIWSSGKKYLVVAKARDKAGNVQQNFVVWVSSSQFIYDTQPPQTVLTTPSQQYVNTLTNISGTATDATQTYYVGMSGANKVKLVIKNVTDGLYYQGGGVWAVDVATLTASGTADWSNWWYLGASGYWLSDKQYEIKHWAVDDLGNEGTPVSFTVIYDTTPPTVQITYPQDNAKLNTMPVISGTANADLSGLDDVEIKISSWVGTGWSVVTAVTKPQVSVFITSFSYQTSGLIDGTTYQVVARAKDKATNWSVVYSTITFVYDVKKPQVVIVKPVNDRYYGTNSTEVDYYLPVLTGTASDEFGISKTEIQLFDVASSSYWHTTGWVVGVSSWHYAGVESWQYTTPPLVDGKRYRLEVRTYDLAGNLSEYATSFFYYDETPAQIVIQKPDAEYHNYLPTISGTAEEQPPTGAGGTFTSKLYTTRIRIQINPPNGDWWNNAQKVFNIPDDSKDNAWYTPTKNVAVGLASDDWYVTSVDTPTWIDGQTYRVETQVYDVARNTSTIVSHQFTYDITPPTAKLIEPPEAGSLTSPLARRTLPTITGTASDTTPGKVGWVELRIWDSVDNKYWSPSQNDFITYTNPEDAFFVALTTSAQWTSWQYLFDENKWTEGKVYRIEVRSKDRATNYSTQYSTSYFKWDRTPPTSKVVFPEDKKSYSQLPSISGTAKDLAGAAIGVGIADNTKVKVAIRDNSTGLWWDGFSAFNKSYSERARDASSLTDYGNANYGWTYTGITDANLTSGVSYYIQVWAEDRAGNVQTLFGECTFYFDKAEPDSYIQLPEQASPYKLYTSLNIISGTAKDLPDEPYINAGVGKVELHIRDVLDDKPYLGSNTWGAAGATNYVLVSYLSSGGTFWYYTDVPQWQQGKIYRITSRATDKVIYPSGNVETTEDVRYIVIDASAPVARLVLPSEVYDTKYKELTSVTGTTVDYPLSPLYKSDVQKVEVLIQDLAYPSTYWNGTSWQEGHLLYGHQLHQLG